MSRPNNKYYSDKSKKNGKMRREQPRKDSKRKRVNFDNTRVSKFERDVDEITSKQGKEKNDIEWYSSNPELVKAAGSIPFASVIGAGLPWKSGQQVLPGILSMHWVPALGEMTTESVFSDSGQLNPPFAVNQAGKAMYSYVVHANSRNRSYEYQDLMMIVLAGSQVFSILSAMIRAYGIARTYSEQNLYTPNGLLTAMGFQPDDVRANLSNMWFSINELIARTQQIWIPNTLPLTKRWFWLNGSVFTDANEAKAQEYVFVQNVYWIYDETLLPSGGGLRSVNYPEYEGNPNASVYTQFNPGSVQYKWTQWYNAASAMIDALIQSEDRGIIMGDILKAYGPERIYSMAPIPVDYTIAPVYNQEVLTQIENMTVCSAQVNGVLQTPQGIQPAWGAAINTTTLWKGVTEVDIANDSVVNFHFPTQPTPADVMIATRLKTHSITVGNGFVMNWYTDTTGDGIKVNYCMAQGMTIPQDQRIEGVQYAAGAYARKPVSCGTEIVRRAYIYAANGYGVSYSSINFGNIGTGDWTTVSTQTAFNLITEAMAFDWHPFLYRVDNGSTAGAVSKSTYPQVNGAFGDYDNYTLIDTETLNKLHLTAVYSLFGNPQSLNG